MAFPMRHQPLTSVSYGTTSDATATPVTRSGGAEVTGQGCGDDWGRWPEERGEGVDGRAGVMGQGGRKGRHPGHGAAA